MVPNLSLSFWILIAHFIPGASLVLLLLFRYQNEVSEVAKVIDWASQNATLGIIIGVIVSVAVGIILGSSRFSIIRLIRKISKKCEELHKYDISRMTTDDIHWHEWIIENRYRFHQVYGNFCLIFSIGFFLCLPLFWLVMDIMLFLICFSAAIYSYVFIIGQLRKRFPLELQKGD